MKSKTLINIMGITLLIAMIAGLMITLWASFPVTALLATVSWNG